MVPFDQIRTQLHELLAAADPASVSVAQAMALTSEFVGLSKLVDAGLVLFAQRAVTGDPAGKGAATRRLARDAGITMADAERIVQASDAVPALAATRAAVLEGRLSRTQAAVVAEAAKASPESERDLLRTAADQDLVGLRRHAERVLHAAGDEKSRKARARSDRNVSTWVRNGMWHMHAKGPVDDGARIQFAHRQFWEAALAAAPKDQREPFGAYGFDGLVAMANAAINGNNNEIKLKKRRWQGIVRVDASAIRRGHTVPGEVSEIIGVGPIDIAAATDLLGEATVRLLIKDGRDVLSMATATRAYPEALRMAVAERDNWECANRSCSNIGFVEYDHDQDFTRTHDSSYCNLHPFCTRCHDLKTYGGYRIIEHDDGTVDLIPPDDPDPP